MRRWLGLALVAVLPLAAHAQTYKWKDAQGQVHFTQTPPKDGKYEVIGGAPPPAAAPNQDAINKSLSDEQKAAPAQQKAQEQATAQQAQRQEACRAAIERLAYLDAHQARRLATKDDKGNVTRMNEEEFQKQRAAEQEKMNKNCD